MKTVRNIVMAVVAGSALSLGAAAFAQDAKKPEAKPEAKKEHRGEHRQHGMNRMREMRENCHGESRGVSGGEHNHS